jgi:NCAIR mutase (PurE)-related protein
MDASGVRVILESVRNGALTVEEAERRLRWAGLSVEMGNFATVDTHRRLRCGFPEVIFGQGKTADQVVAILEALLERSTEGVLATRLDAGAADLVQRTFPEGRYHRLSRAFRIGPERPADERLGKVVVVTGGTADLPVAEEAHVTAEAWGCEVSMLADVGVAGLHRLLGRLDRLEGADVLVVVAGMEAALPSVVGGLVDCPVIGVPTSVGYGAHFHGLASLLGMLNSCASNVVVTNIDAGFNGGYVAGLMARRAGLARSGSRAAEIPASSQNSETRGD